MHSDELRVWIDALAAAGCDPKRSGKQWQARCPAHDDVEPSLSVSRGDRRPVVANCFAGCEFDEIVDALPAVRELLKARASGEDRRPAARPATKPRDASRGGKPPRWLSKLPTGPDRTRYDYSDADGEIVFVVIRRDTINADTGEPAKKFSQWTPVDGGWVPVGLKGQRPLWRLQQILANPGQVIVTEGEKCALAVLEAWPHRNVTTYAGGTQNWQRSDFSPISGWEVTVLADGDEAGHKAAREVANHLASHRGCVVWIVLPELDGTDIADWVAEAPGAAAKRIAESRVRHDPGPQIGPTQIVVDNTGGDSNADPEEVGEAMADELADNAHYRLLGIGIDDRVAVRIALGRVLRFSLAQMTLKSTQVAMAPLVFWHGRMTSDIYGVSQAMEIGNALIELAKGIGMVDLNRVTGRGAVRLDNNRIVYHLGDRLLDGDEEKPLNSVGDRVWVSEPRIPLGASATDDQLRALASAVLTYRWATPSDGRRLMGWVAAAIAGGALDWRPHIMMLAPAGTGKSWFIRQVVRPLMGPLVEAIADATAASLARHRAHSSLPIMIDEAEPTNNWVLDVIKQLRVASGGEGLRLRADNASSGVVSQDLRYCALLSATKMPALAAADATRLSMVRLGSKVVDWPKVEADLQAAIRPADAIRAALVRQVPFLADGARDAARTMAREGMDSREASVSAALTAGWWVWGLDDEIVPAGISGKGRDDAADAILELLAIEVRHGGATTTTLSELCKASAGPTIAANYGLRNDPDRGLLIDPTHRGLAKALSRTMYAEIDLAKLLIQMRGVAITRHPQHFGKLRKRAIVVPHNVLESIGVDLVAPVDEAQRVAAAAAEQQRF